MAYSLQTAHCAVCRETRMLQVRCAHPTGNFAPKRPSGTFRCCAWLILRFRTIVHADAGVPLGLFGKPKRSSFSRFAASIKPHYALFSKTHMLQVRCAAGTGSRRQPLRPLRRPAPPFAPKRLFKPFRCSAWLIPYRQRPALSVGKRSCFRFAALTLRVQGSRRATPQALRRPAPLTQGSQGALTGEKEDFYQEQDR